MGSFVTPLDTVLQGLYPLNMEATLENSPILVSVALESIHSDKPRRLRRRPLAVSSMVKSISIFYLVSMQKALQSSLISLFFLLVTQMRDWFMPAAKSAYSVIVSRALGK